MNEFSQMCCYVSSNPKANFSNYTEALIAFRKHKVRMDAQDDSDDALRLFYDEYTHKIRGIHRRGFRPQNWYNFTEVKEAIKKHKLWRKQVFNSRNICGNPTETIYYKDGVCIEYASCYDYIEVFGLNPCDYKVLVKAYQLRE